MGESHSSGPHIFTDPVEHELVRTATKFITSAQVLALFATPVEIVPSPGAGVTLQFLGADVFLDFNTAAYVAGAGEDLVFKYTNAAGKTVSIPVDGTLIAAGADTLVFAAPDATSPIVAAETVNAAIVAHILVGEVITGDSPIKVSLHYRRVKTSVLEGIA